MDNNIIERGHKAERILNSDDFKDLISEIRQDLFNQFSRTNVADADAREQLHLVTYGVSLFEKKLIKFVEEARFETNRDGQTTSFEQ